jgi:hypothetical protein
MGAITVITGTPSDNQEHRPTTGLRPRVLAAVLSAVLAGVGLLAAPAIAQGSNPGDLDGPFTDALTTGLDATVISAAWDGSGYLLGGYFTNGPGSGAGNRRVFRVKADGTTDAAFTDTLTSALAATTGNAGLDDAVRSVVWDGSGYLVGGIFTNAPGSGAGNKRVFRVKADGTLDTAFNNALTGALAGDNGLNGLVYTMAWDGSGYLIAGAFTNGPGSGAGNKRVFRVKADGTLDTAFNDALTGALAGTGGLDDDAITVVWDGSGYVIAGAFTNGPGAERVFRVKADGTLDTAFNNALAGALSADLDSSVVTTVWDGAGYLVGGAFTNGPGSGAGNKRVFRVKADGTLDTAFNNSLTGALASATGDAGLNNIVITGAWDDSGYVVGGLFANGPGSGAGSKRVFRVKADGTLDTAFNNALTGALASNNGLDDLVHAAVWDGSGYLMGGAFTNGPGTGPGAKRLFRVLGPVHTVTFDANGGSGTMGAQTANVPTALTANAFVRAGYGFAGWNTQAGGGGTWYADGAVYPFVNDATLYAQWTVVAVPVPAKVRSVTAKSKAGMVKVKWAASATAVTGYQVQYSTNKKKWRKAGNAGPTSSMFVWRKGKKGKTYYLRVAAQSSAGRGPWSKAVKVKVR